MTVLLRSALLCVGLCLVGAAQSASLKAEALKPVDADYVVFYGKVKIADATLSLTSEKRRTWRTRTQFMPLGVASWFARDTTVESEFRLLGGQIYLSRTEYERADKVYEGYWFGGEAKALYEGRSYSLEAPLGVLDNLTMVLQAALWAKATPEGGKRRQLVAARGKIREYELALEASERIKTDLGEFDARVVSARRNDKPRYRYWFSDAHGFMPAQVARLNDDNDIVWQATLQGLQWH